MGDCPASTKSGQKLFNSLELIKEGRDERKERAGCKSNRSCRF